MPEALQLDGQVAIVTGAGQQLGRAYAVELGRRGAAVVVNDIGRTNDGRPTAELVAREINDSGGSAIASLESVSDPEGPDRIADAALEAFGRIDVLINNAGVARFAPLDEQPLDKLLLMYGIHLRGAFRLTQRSFAVMRDQGYGRIVTMGSSSGAFGLENHSAYGSLKMALAGLTTVLAAEGAPFDIKANAVQPRAPLPGRTKESRTQQKLGDFAYRLHPAFSAPLVVYLASRACRPSGAAFSSAAGCYSRVITAVSEGRPLAGLTPGALDAEARPSAGHLPRFQAPASAEELLALAGSADADAASTGDLKLDGRVALVTAVGTPAGEAVARTLARHGAAVVVTDPDGSAAERVAADIEDALAVAARTHVEEEASGLVAAALERFGRLDVVVHHGPAGAGGPGVTDVSLADLDAAVDAQIVGPLILTKYAFPHLRERGFGRIVSLCSAAGVFGAAGASSHGAASAGRIGLTNVASLEGPAHGVLANAVIAFDDRPQDADAVAQVVARLASPESAVTRGMACVAGGWVGGAFLALTRGWVSPGDQPPTMEAIAEHFHAIEDPQPGVALPAIVDDETDAVHDELRRQLHDEVTA